MDDGVLAQAPVPLAVAFDVGASVLPPANTDFDIFIELWQFVAADALESKECRA